MDDEPFNMLLTVLWLIGFLSLGLISAGIEQPAIALITIGVAFMSGLGLSNT